MCRETKIGPEGRILEMWTFQSFVFSSTISANNIITTGHYKPDAVLSRSSDHPTFAFAAVDGQRDHEERIRVLWPGPR